jgi:hypothetical protein
MKDHIDTILETATPRQTTVERERLFLRVMSEVGVPTEADTTVPSPYFSWRTYFTNTRLLVAAVLIVVLGTGGTVAAAESAKPGDALFPIEKATEQLRLTLASAERRGELEARFLEKRFAEVSELLTEETLVASGTKERVISEAGESRIVGAIAVLLAQIEGVNDPKQAERLRNLLREVETIRVDGRATERADDRRIRIDDTRFEVRMDTERIRIDDTDGDMRIRYDDNGDSDDDTYEATPSRNSVDTSDDSKQEDDDGRTIDDEQDEVREQDDNEGSEQNAGTGTVREDDNRGGDEDREDEKSADSGDDEVDDARDQKEDDRKGHTDDDKDR